MYYIYFILKKYLYNKINDIEYLHKVANYEEQQFYSPYPRR